MINAQEQFSNEQLKDDVIHALIEMNVFKMPDGRQLYQVSLPELLTKYESIKQTLTC